MYVFSTSICRGAQLLPSGGGFAERLLSVLSRDARGACHTAVGILCANDSLWLHAERLGAGLVRGAGGLWRDGAFCVGGAFRPLQLFRLIWLCSLWAVYLFWKHAEILVAFLVWAACSRSGAIGVRQALVPWVAVVGWCAESGECKSADKRKN